MQLTEDIKINKRTPIVEKLTDLNVRFKCNGSEMKH